MRPIIFPTFLMWMLADLFTVLPEVGDVDKLKLVFFFDEVNLLFIDVSQAFLEQVELTVNLTCSTRVSGYSSTPNCPRICPMTCCPNWAPMSNTLCGCSLRMTRRCCPRRCVLIRKPMSYDLESVLTSLGIGEDTL
ncbi:helicase HerA-like domain-containing protein [Mycobacterium lepromatosis]|uniref:helicase HerA-like domain-containing protein n=1 Tax=Mycobacterium lepromatosis TaxID=480418 RepID=UPI003CFC3836